MANNTLLNDGNTIGINTPPMAKHKLYVLRPIGEFGSDSTAIYGFRSGGYNPENGGSSWAYYGVDAAVKGYSLFGNNYTAGVAGYNYHDFPLSAGVIGGTWNADYWGALGYLDATYNQWAGYFLGNVNITGTLKIQGGTPGAGKVLTSDASGLASWQTDLGTGTVTSINTNNGITGGPITTTGTIGLTGNALSLHNLSTTGLLVRTGGGIVSRSIFVTGNGISILNGDGLAGNPMLSLNIGAGATQVAAGNHTHALLVRGTGLTGSNYDGSLSTTLAVDFGTGALQVASGDHTHTGLLPTGVANQTLRHNGTNWIPNNVLQNNGTAVAVNVIPSNRYKLYVNRPFGEHGADSAAIYAYRGGGSYPVDGGTSWILSGIDAAIKGSSYMGNNYSAGIAGYNYNDYPLSCAVFGGQENAAYWGALAYKDAVSNIWAGYFTGNVYASGNTGIGTTTPTALLHTNGIGTGEGNVLFVGSFKSSSPGNPPSSGAGTRMMWYPDKAAFRAGYVSGANWDKDSIGNYSVAMGLDTRAKGYCSTAMGFGAIVTGSNSLAAGSNGTTASGSWAYAMGYAAVASANVAFALGESVTASGYESHATGYNTTASGEKSHASGNYVIASGDYSTAIGYHTTTSGINSTALGNYASTNSQNGAFVIGDNSTTSYVNSYMPNRLVGRFDNGYFLYTKSDLSTYVYVLSGGGSWSGTSDKKKKENFIALDPEVALLKIKSLPVTEWNYKAQEASNRHIGPMAQDFYNAFKLGGVGNDTSITAFDIDGVNMIGIQALENRTADLKNQILELQQLLNKQNAKVETLESELSAALESNKKMDALIERLNKLEQINKTSSSIK